MSVWRFVHSILSQRCKSSSNYACLKKLLTPLASKNCTWVYSISSIGVWGFLITRETHTSMLIFIITLSFSFTPSFLLNITFGGMAVFSNANNRFCNVWFFGFLIISFPLSWQGASHFLVFSFLFIVTYYGNRFFIKNMI